MKICFWKMKNIIIKMKQSMREVSHDKNQLQSNPSTQSYVVTQHTHKPNPQKWLKTCLKNEPHQNLIKQNPVGKSQIRKKRTTFLRQPFLQLPTQPNSKFMNPL